jgi:penicillin-binding protein 1B
VYLDAQVQYKFEGKRWSLPAQVFARPLEFFDGQALNLSNLEGELTLLRYIKSNSASAPGLYTINGKSVSIYRRAHTAVEGPQPDLLVKFEITGDVIQGLTVNGRASSGIENLEPFKIGGVYPRVKEERELVNYSDIPPGLIAALIATEDKNFYEHFGVSPTAIARAAFVNVKAGRVVQGGSTLTQQLVKNFYLTSERSLWRKANEAIMAILLDFHYSKEEILETYINDIYLGQSGSTAIHGFSMASRFYFAKDLSACSLNELALLVAIVKGPSYYDPRRHPQRARTRRDLVLSLMNQDNWITKAEMLKTQALSLNVVSKPRFQSNRYPAFLDLVKRQLARDYLEEDLQSEGLKIYTTLDPQLQQGLEKSVQQEMDKLDPDSATQSLQAGAIFTAVGTGEVLAIVGDRSGRYSGFNRALDADRSIGSLIKPAIYLTALEQPERYHLASLISDEPFFLEFEDGEKWAPNNFDGNNKKSVPLFEGLADSLNLASARLGLQLGLDNVHATLRKLGVTQNLNPYPSLLLGAQAMTPFEVAKFYQTIASNGFNMPLRAIREVTDANGQVLSRYPFQVEQVIEPQASYLLQSAMQEAMRRGTGKSAYRRLPNALNTAGKTGTTNDFRDSWFAGFSGDYLGVVWLGKDNNEPTGLTGSSGALKVWTSFMASVPQYPLSVPRPSGVSLKWFDSETWQLSDEGCRGAEALPVWGEAVGTEHKPCSVGFNSIKGWFKSWLQ